MCLCVDGVFADLSSSTTPFMPGCNTFTISGGLHHPVPTNDSADGEVDPQFSSYDAFWSNYLSGNASTVLLVGMHGVSAVTNPVVQSVASPAVVAGRAQPLVGDFNVSSLVVTPTTNGNISFGLQGCIALSDPFGEAAPLILEGMQMNVDVYGNGRLVGRLHVAPDSVLTHKAAEARVLESVPSMLRHAPVYGVGGSAAPAPDRSVMQSVPFHFESLIEPVEGGEAWGQFMATLLSSAEVSLELKVGVWSVIGVYGGCV